MVTFGLDISHHQDLGLDLAAARRDGIEFVFIKATEGATFVDPEFSANVAEARAAGQLVAAYHYVRANATAADQCANIDRTIPRDVPVILDVERNSGSLNLTRAMLEWLGRAGQRGRQPGGRVGRRAGQLLGGLRRAVGGRAPVHELEQGGRSPAAGRERVPRHP